MTYFIPNLFHKAQPTVESCFELLMNKKYSPATKEKKAVLIHDFLALSVEKDEVKLVNEKIQKLNPQNLQKVLSLAHDLALKYHSGKAKYFEDNLNELETKYHLKPIDNENLQFNPELEKKIKPKEVSLATLGKAFGLALLILIPSFGFSKILESQRDNFSQEDSKSNLSLANQTHSTSQSHENSTLPNMNEIKNPQVINEVCKEPAFDVVACQAILGESQINSICSDYLNSHSKIDADFFYRYLNDSMNNHSRKDVKECDCDNDDGIVCISQIAQQISETSYIISVVAGIAFNVYTIALSVYMFCKK